MSKVRADKLVDRAGTGAVELTEGGTVPTGKYISGAGGINITGVATANSFSGNLTGSVTSSGALTISDATASTSTSTGALKVTGGVGIAKSLFVGEGVSVAGTITYDDVTNIDSVGIVTAGKGLVAVTQGLNVVAGVVTTPGLHVTGIATVGTALSVYPDNVSFYGLLREKVNVTAGKLSANTAINLDNGMLHYFTVAETTTSKPNIISGTGINTDMSIGDAISVTVITTAAAAGYSVDWRVDGVEGVAGVTTYWSGGSAPSAGGSAGVDMYALTFVKTANATYSLFANNSNLAS